MTDDYFDAQSPRRRKRGRTINIQSLSIVVPAPKCWNKCPFCVSRMHCENYGKSIVDDDDLPLPEAYTNRMQFVRDYGCNAMIITGDTEPQQNPEFIRRLLFANQDLRTPFYNISLQTTGSGLDEEDILWLATFGLTTISFSISSFDTDRNATVIGMPRKAKRDFYEVQQWAKKYNLVTRASINLTDEFSDMEPEEYFTWANAHRFDQITFRRMYADGDTPQAQWLAEHNLAEEKYIAIRKYIVKNGTQIARLPFGFIKWSVHGVSTVIDDNCMSKGNIDDMKYAILRPNGHLYSRWDDPGSLIF